MRQIRNAKSATAQLAGDGELTIKQGCAIGQTFVLGIVLVMLWYGSHLAPAIKTEPDRSGRI